MYADPNRSRFRSERFEKFLLLVQSCIKMKGRCRILDAGGEHGYWTPYLDRLRGLPLTLTIVNLQDRTPAFDDDRFEFQSGDARNLSVFADSSFDLVHSNSVIEHVGRWPDMLAMAAEVRRVAASYFVQTPYFWFPVEPHFRTVGYQWLPEQWRIRVHLRRKLGFFPRAQDLNEAMKIAQSCVLLDQLQFRALFPDAMIFKERYYGLTKSLVAIRDATSAN